MKRINFAMLLFAAIATISGCNKEASVASEEGLTSFVAYLDDDQTKTNLDGVKVRWTEGDEVSVNGRTFVATPDPNNSLAATFTLKSGQTAPTGTNMRMFYPTGAYYSTSGRLKLATSYTYNSASLLSVSPMYATYTGQSSTINDQKIKFRNVCGLLEIGLVGDQKIKSVAVTADQGITGNLTSVAISNDVLTYTATGLTGKTVTINCTEAVQLDADNVTKFYVPLPEKTYGSLSIAITTASGKVKTITSTATSMEVKKNNIYRMPVTTVEFPTLSFEAEIEVVKNETTSPSSSTVSFNVTPADKEVAYMFTAQSKRYVSQFADALALAEGYSTEMLADLKDLFAQYSIPFTFENLKTYEFIYSGDLKDYDEIDYFTPNSDYVAFAFAIDADFNVSPAVAVEFTTPKYVMPAWDATYEDYLGQWAFGTNVITISEKVKDQTYAVTGFSNMNYSGLGINIASVEALFENGNFILKEQDLPEKGVHSTYGGLDLALTGVDAAGEPNYPWSSATPSVALVGQYANDVINVTSDFASLVISWIIQSGTYAGRGNYNIEAATISSKMTRPEGLPPTSLYGTYVCPSATEGWPEDADTYTNWTWVVSAQGTGVSITGYDAAIDAICVTNNIALNPAPFATWDASASTLTVASGTETGLATGDTEDDVVVWSGVVGGYYADCVWKVDLQAGTISLESDGFQAHNADGAYSYFTKPLVFTKTTAAPAPASVKSNGNNRFDGVKFAAESVAEPSYKRAAVKNADESSRIMKLSK